MKKYLLSEVWLDSSSLREESGEPGPLSITLLSMDCDVIEWASKEMKQAHSETTGLYIEGPREQVPDSGVYMVRIANFTEGQEEHHRRAQLNQRLQWKFIGYLCNTGWEPIQADWQATPQLNALSLAHIFRKAVES